MEGTGRDAVREAIMTIDAPESRPWYWHIKSINDRVGFYLRKHLKIIMLGNY